tara:strand:+ start:426032 stop:426904 length:873 start_codon:yes stop_codon:yes gene_type:complete
VQLGPSEIVNQPATADENAAANARPPSEQSPDHGEHATIQDANPANPTALEGLLNRFSTPDMLFVFGVVLLLFLMMRMLRKNHKANARRTNSQPSPADRIANIHGQAQDSMAPAYKVMVDAEDMARRLSASLDNKAARLELLIEEADQKLALLNRTLAGQQTQPEQTTISHTQNLNQSPSPARSIDPALLDRARIEQDLEDRQTRVVGRIDHTPTPAPIPQPISEPKPQPERQPEPQPEPAPEPAPEPVSIQTQIAQLSAAGHSNIDIAHQLKQPIGQVELILNLRKQQG